MSKESLNKDIYNILNEYSKKIQKNIEANLSWTSNLKNNVNIIVNEKESSLELQMPKYAIFVEYGRKLGKQPPLNVIYNWCQSKGIDTKYAFPIARKIGKEGIEPKPFMHEFYDEYDNMKDDITDVIIKSLFDDINNLKN